MRFSRFFIDRPIFAAVLSIVILIAGILSIQVLPISEYPDVVPPSVVVSPAEEPAPPKPSMASMFLESLGGITAYVLVASGVLVVVFNVAFRLFPPIR